MNKALARQKKCVYVLRMRRVKSRSVTPHRELTAWGIWVAEQPKEARALTTAMEETGVSWTTVNKARYERVSEEVARALSAFTNGQVEAKDIAKPGRRYRITRRRRLARRAA